MANVPRMRLTSAIRESMDLGVALIVAPAGAGKTAAALDAVGPGAASVEFGRDVDVTTVAVAIIAAVAPRARRAFVQFAATLGESEDRVADIIDWVSVRLRSYDGVIFVEDAHRLVDSDAASFLGGLIEATLGHARWVVTSREELPAWPLGTWLAREYMRLPITAADLAFTPDEAREVANAVGAVIGDDDLQSIVAASEGWPLIVRVALTEWNRTRAVVPLWIRTRPVLFDFFERQVWASVSARDRELLVAIALLVEAREAVLEQAGFLGARRVVATLMGRVPLMSVRAGEVRLHDLFRDFVLEKTQQEVIGAAGARLVDAAERLGMIDQALDVSVRLALWDHAIALLVRFTSELLESGAAAAVSRALNAFPAPYRDASWTAVRALHLAGTGLAVAAADLFASTDLSSLPEPLRARASLAAARLAINRGQGREALALLESLPDPGMLGWLDDRLDRFSLCAAAAAGMGDLPAARAYAARATEVMSSASAAARARNLAALAFASWYSAEYGRAESLALEAAELADALGMPTVAITALSVLQAVSAMTQIVPSATATYVRRLIKAATDAGQRHTIGLAYMTQLGLAADHGDDEAYEEALAELRVRPTLSPRHEMNVRYSRVIFDCGHGRIQAAISTLRSVDDQIIDRGSRIFRDALMGVLLAVEGDSNGAIVALRRPAVMGEVLDFDTRRWLAYAGMFRGFGQWLLGNVGATVGLVGAEVRELPQRDVLVLGVLRSICMAARSSLTTERLGHLIAPLGAHELHGLERFVRIIANPPLVGVRGLTKTELEILRAFRTGATTGEIAVALKRSPRTIDGHVSTITRKLGCVGRAAAVAIAQGNGWLDN